MTYFNDQLETSYLKHIRLALSVNDRSAPYRTFFDNWFAYRVRGPFLSGSGNPHWFNNPDPKKHRAALMAMHFRSVAAGEVLRGERDEPLVKDHAIPVSCLWAMMRAVEFPTLEDMRAYLDRWYRVGVLTKSEHRALGVCGYGSKMPEGWRESDGCFARYEYSGIEACPQSVLTT